MNTMTSHSREGLPSQLNAWLVSLQLPGRNGETSPSTADLQSGLLVADIVKLLLPAASQLQLANGSTLLSRQSNWNALTEPLGQLGVKLAPQEKGKLVSGDRDTILSVLERLRVLSAKQRRESQVDITKLDAKKELRASTSLLEMLLLVLMRNFNLSSKECVTLLSSQGKYLAHILAKGLKGDFTPVEGVYAELSKNLAILIGLSKDKESKEFVFKALKPGVISKSEKVAFLSFDLLASFCKAQPNQMDMFKNLFSSTAFLGVRRHKSIVSRVIRLLVELNNFGTNTIDMIKEFADDEDLLHCYLQLCDVALEREKLTEVEQMVGWEQLVQNALDAGSRWTNKQQSEYLSFVLLLMRGGFKSLENGQLLKLFTTLCDSRSKIPGQATKMHSLCFLFESLAELGRSKNSIAPALYKLLVGLLPQMFLSDESDQYFLNFCSIVQQFPKIPLSLLLESFAAGYSQNQQNIDLSSPHIKLLTAIADSEELELKNTLLLLDILTKIQLNNAVFASQIMLLISSIVRKVSDQEIVQQLLNKFIKISLAIYYANEKKKQPKRKSLVPGKTKQSASDVLLRLKNLIIYQTLDKLLALKLAINQGALPLIGFTIVQLRSMGPDRPELLMKLLGHYGNPEEVIKEFEPQQEILPQATNDEFPLDKKLKPQSTSRFNNVTPKVLQGLQKYHNSYIKKVEKAEALDKQRQDQAQRRIQLKKSMEIKMLQQGLTLRSDQQIQLMFEFDSREKIMKLQKPHKNNEVSYFDLESEEERDIRAIDYLQKKYHKAIRYMYVRYSNSIGDVRTGKDFDQFAQKTQSIKAADVWKMLKEHSLDQYLTVYECQEMVKLVNYRSGNKSDPLVLDFTGFERCLLQLAVFMFSRPPKDLRVNPPSLLYEEMFRMMRDKCEKTGVNPQLFDDPDTAYFSEGEVIRQLNRKLAQNPSHILPEGYKKIVEKKVDFEYNICTEIVRAAYKDVYEIIDELLFNEFNFHLLEPFTKISTKAKARPALFYFNQKKEEDLARSQQRLRVRSELEKTTKLSQTLRNELARYPMKERAIASKVAAVVEDILIAVDMGHDQIGLKLENTAIKSKKERDDEQKRLKEAEDHKRKQRQEELKKQLQQVKDKRTQKERMEEQKKQKEEERRKQQEQKRKLKEKQAKNKVAEYQSKKKEDEEREKKEIEQKKQKEKEEEARKKRQAEQTKRKIEEAKKKKEQEQQQKKQQEEKEKRKKRAYEDKLFKEKQKQLKEKIKEYKSTKGDGKPEEKKDKEGEQVKAVDA